jgi:ABC-type transport system substrate-binding protein
VQLSRIIDPELTIYYWNMQDPVWGGLSKEKVALRRAVAMAHKVEDEIRIVDNGEAVPLEFPIPPSVVGHDPKYRSSIQYNPAAANALLDQFGYKKEKTATAPCQMASHWKSPIRRKPNHAANYRQKSGKNLRQRRHPYESGFPSFC